MMVENPKFLDQLMPDSGGNNYSPHLLELETKLRNHGKGPYLGLLLVESAY